MKENFLSVKETANYLKSSTSTIYNYICSKKIPANIFIKLGSKVLFIESKLNEWLFSKGKGGN
ncbi:MAG: helix-turn-helix domain-containing protein [Candidatus Gastranaerophilales bacterium]|nr:helix-turn-helix domain-containing protein [Candidatus Gastranaerophilales bacterium]